MSEADIRKAYADVIRGMADRIEDGTLAREVQHMNEIGELTRIMLPEGYPSRGDATYSKVMMPRASTIAPPF